MIDASMILEQDWRKNIGFGGIYIYMRYGKLMMK